MVPGAQLPISGSHPCLLLSPQDSPEAGEEREEEQAFLVSLYKFMKERHTPIERVPHLGFKQSASQGEGYGSGGRFRGTVGIFPDRTTGKAPLLQVTLDASRLQGVPIRRIPP